MNDITFKNKYSFESNEVLDAFARNYFCDCYCAMILNVGPILSSLSIDNKTKEINEIISKYRLKDQFDTREIMYVDYIVLEFESKDDMEYYMWLTDEGELHVRFYDNGIIYHENID